MTLRYTSSTDRSRIDPIVTTGPTLSWTAGLSRLPGHVADASDRRPHVDGSDRDPGRGLAASWTRPGFPRRGLIREPQRGALLSRESESASAFRANQKRHRN